MIRKRAICELIYVQIQLKLSSLVKSYWKNLGVIFLEQ